MIYQRTIKREIEFSGIGIHSGLQVSVKIKPAPVNTGIVFFRGDLPGSPRIPALVDNVLNMFRGTTLGVDGIEIKTVEHLLSSLAGLSLDNVFVEVYGNEVPIMDGSSYDFVEGLCASGFEEQKDGERHFFMPREVVWISRKDSYIMVLPYDGLKITYIIDYKHPVIKTQMEEIVVEPETYIESIARARTYGFMEEVQYLLNNNLALGGSLENALIINDEGYSSPLRYPNEPVRHKILDLIGDMSLLGTSLRGHILAVRSSHKLNLELVKALKP